MEEPVEQTSATLDMIACVACRRPNPMDARFCAGCGVPTGRGAEPALPVSEADPLVGRIIAGRYRLESLIGRGGMGVVYKVEHVRIGKLMAMKLLHGELARDKDTIKRFKREAEAVSKLSHPNTVQIFDFDSADGLTYLVMEYVAGRDLGSIVGEGSLPFARVAKICAQVCASVAEAHERGIVHRDIKPENIMVSQTRTQADVVKVLDFGLARLREGDDAGRITRAGSLVGTPYYMAPEHIRGDAADHRVDIYAIGAVIYKSCCGVPPFSASTPVGVLTKHLTEALVPPRERVNRPDLPNELDAIVMKAMAKEPADRYARAEDLREDLITYLASIGEADGLGSGRATREPTQGRVTTVSGRVQPVPVATKDDVDRFERGLRRLSRAGYLFAAVVLIAAAAAGWFVWKGRPQPVLTTETEPNDEPALASHILEGRPLTAHIGKRLSGVLSDQDVYVLSNPGARPRVIRVDVDALPNMDLLLEIVRAGSETPQVLVDSGGVNQPERVPNFPIEGAMYYLRVREKWVAGRMPTENVSDAYTIRWQWVTPGADDEREVNNSLDEAGVLSPNGVRRGWIGWPGDVDTFCLDADAQNLTVALDAVQTLDLVLRMVDRTDATSRRYDAHGKGEPESSPTIANARARTTCVEVSAATEGEGARGEPTTPYVLRTTSDGAAGGAALPPP